MPFVRIRGRIVHIKDSQDHGKQAGRFLGKVGPLKKKASQFAAAHAQALSSPNPKMNKMAHTFAAKSAHYEGRANLAQKAGKLAGSRSLAKPPVIHAPVPASNSALFNAAKKSKTFPIYAAGRISKTSVINTAKSLKRFGRGSMVIGGLAAIGAGATAAHLLGKKKKYTIEQA